MEIRVGMRIQSANNTEVIFTITKIGLKDSAGFNSAEITFEDGEKEIAPIAVIQQAINSGCKILEEI